MLLFCLLLASLVIGETLNAEEVLNVVSSDPVNIDKHINKWRMQLKVSPRSNRSYCSPRTALSCTAESRKVGCGDDLITTQSRVAIFISNQTATQDSIVAQIGDTKHQRAINASRGMYDNASFAAFDLESMVSFATVMGPCFNFLGQPYIPGLAGIGGYLSPCGNVILVPYIIGVNESLRGSKKYVYSVTFDSADLDQGESNDRWRVLASGNVALVLGNSSVVINTPQGKFYGGNGIGYANYAQVNLDCRHWDENDSDCVLINRILPPSVSFQVSDTPYKTEFPNFQISMTPLVWENTCCQRGTGSIVAYLAGPNMDFVGKLNKYQITTLILPNDC